MKLRNRKVLVTGCAGFVGSHMTDRLLALGNTVLGIDNFSTGKRSFLEKACSSDRFDLIGGDLLSMDLAPFLDGVEVLCHFAANPDVRVGASDTRVHFQQNLEVTYRLLEAARENGVKDFVFPSTSTVYGEPDTMPTPETFGPLVPISLYGASKLGCEALVSGYCHTFDMSSVIYRFANVVGSRSTHNVLHDFVRKLRQNPKELEILGREPGTSKSYVHIDDCLEGMIIGAEKADEQVEILNIGSKDRATVKEIADIVVEGLELKEVRYRWTGGVDGGRGWTGDVRQMLLSVERLERLGWRPRYSSSEAIAAAVREIIVEKSYDVS
ncbi:MAG: NAD-dependent epimerase/dehydratase family protein [Methanomassiliicoccales archaeon]|nr:NAD-dependent epimerase/dehydratase family protein [Methanomassiliicoccales archaeon]